MSNMNERDLPNLWKYAEGQHALYIQNKEVMYSINRYYLKKGFYEMATYEKNGKVIARQYLLPSEHYRAAKRLALLGNI